MAQLLRANVASVTPTRYSFASSWEVLWVWRPASAFVNAPLVVFIPNGWGFNPGFTASWPDPDGTGVPGKLFDLKWAVVSISLPPAANQVDHRQVPADHGLWPVQARALARAISFLKDSATDAAVWGAGNSIDPKKLVGYGEQHAANVLLELACTPAGGFPLMGALPRDLGKLPGAKIYDHRMRAVVAKDPALDWTQFALDPAVTGAQWGDNIHPMFMHRHEGSTWGPQFQSGSPATPSSPQNQLAAAVKRAASPWWILSEAGPAVADCAIYTKYGTQPGSGDGALLTFADWKPGDLKFREDLQKAYYDPSHPFQAEEWDRLLKKYGVTRKTVWGSSADNPTGSTVTSGFNNTAMTDLPGDVSNWLQQTVGLPSLA